MTANPKSNSKNGDALFTGAPASWKTRHVDPMGFECQITFRCRIGIELLEKASAATSYLLENGCLPYVYSRNSYRPVDAKSSEDKGNGDGNSNNGSNSAWYPIHQCEMKR